MFGRLPRILLAFLSPLLIVCGFKLADKWAPPPIEYRIEQVEAVLQDQMQPPAYDAAW